ncbi:L-threonine ammonia-lyase [Aureococcus anophagefferens]|nr:L-threonine ammonia-lyase [Aureococcus anophagefferens]
MLQAALRRAARRPTAARAVGRALSARADAPNIYCDPHKFDYLREILNARVYDVAVETPLQRANSLSRKVGAECLIKREDTQPVFSFKIRGAYNKIGVAMSCNYLKAPATIVMPRGTPRIKVDAVAQHGGDYVRVLLHGDSYDDAYAEATRLVEEEGRTLIHPFDDPLVIAGQGSVGAEILRQTNGKRLTRSSAAAAARLLAGVAAYVKQHVESSDEAGGTYVAVASGANMDFDRLRFVSERADRSEVRLACTMPESPGAFQKFYGLIYPCNVTEFSYRYHRADAPADVIVAFQPQTDQFMDRLAAHGYAPRDITDDELVNTHLRHLNGGRSEFVGDERIFRFDLFHYRNYGHDFGVRWRPGDDGPGGAQAQHSSSVRYTEETHNPTYVQFLTSQRCPKR